MATCAFKTCLLEERSISALAGPVESSMSIRGETLTTWLLFQRGEEEVVVVKEARS
jgi:hypothetical protein